MRISRHHPRDQPQLAAILATAASSSHRVVMHAGHFLLYYDEHSKQTYRCVDEEITSPHLSRFRRDYAQFPLLTWILGLELLGSLPAHLQTQIMILVNDWQHLPRSFSRADFYRDCREIPQSYRHALGRCSDITLLEPRPPKDGTGLDTRPFFSETTLRNQYKKHMDKAIRSAVVPDAVEFRMEADEKIGSLSTGGNPPRDIYRSTTPGDCATEIAQLLFSLATVHECDCFINLYPDACQPSVEYGTEIAPILFKKGPAVVVNVALPSVSVSTKEDMIQRSSVTIYTNS
jgi:hypothetical protein